MVTPTHSHKGGSKDRLQDHSNCRRRYERDQFEYQLGDDEQISHKPFLGADRGQPIAAYAIAKTKDGAIYREVMSVADVEKVRAASKARDAGPWVDWWEWWAEWLVGRWAGWWVWWADWWERWVDLLVGRWER